MGCEIKGNLNFFSTLEMFVCVINIDTNKRQKSFNIPLNCKIRYKIDDVPFFGFF